MLCLLLIEQFFASIRLVSVQPQGWAQVMYDKDTV